MSNDLLTVAQAAERRGVAENTIRYWADHGHLEVAMTVGKRTRLFRAADVDAARVSSITSPLLDGAPVAQEDAA
jgi:excisionase family DNA binding protein